MRWRNVNWLTPQGDIRSGSVTAEGGRFVRAAGEARLRAGADLLLPGLVDLHTHAMAGFPYGSPVEEEGRAAMRALARAGTTAFLFATMAEPEETLAAQCRAIRAARERQSLRVPMEASSQASRANPTEAKAVGPVRANCGEARCLGVYLEGPFLSPDKKGGHVAENLCLPNPAMAQRLNAASGGCLRVVCAAPELSGALQGLPGAVPGLPGAVPGAVVSLAHTAADYELAARAFDAGFSNVTHLFNCMEPLLHRAPGPIGAAAERPSITVELIADGLHSHPSAVRAAFALFGAERICLISDSIAV